MAYLLPANDVDRTSGYDYCQPAGASVGVLERAIFPREGGKQVSRDSVHFGLDL